jgi:hypothetical protein
MATANGTAAAMHPVANCNASANGGSSYAGVEGGSAAAALQLLQEFLQVG